jgi:predicted lipoprotein with Yx(FWY)xxD motif
MRRLVSTVWIPAIFISITGLSTLADIDAEAADAAPAGVDSKFSRYWLPPGSPAEEAYINEPMPPGFQVISSPLVGPVFADSRGRTLYTWPLSTQRNGSVADRVSRPSSCTDEVLQFSAGLMSPYPSGLLLPDLDQRPSCVSVWPPVLASEGAEVGKWSIIKRDDGSDQWAYDGYPLYTSILDAQPGDVRGGTKSEINRDAGVARLAVGPEPQVPPALSVIPTKTGRMVVNLDDFSVYAWDGDEPDKSNCHGECLIFWTPLPAPENVMELGGWTTFERAPGVNQWAFRGEPVYTYNYDRHARSLTGGDVPGWHNVFTQRAPFPPQEFTVQDADFGGEVLADSRGRTIYLYNCIEDTLAQLSCNNPGTTQAYRLAICGNGSVERCRETFPYVIAPVGAHSESPLWSVMEIDPATGHSAAPGQTDALHVWAYQRRPVYTYAGDQRAGITNGQGIGEFSGSRNGFHSFALRLVFSRR